MNGWMIDWLSEFQLGCGMSEVLCSAEDARFMRIYRVLHDVQFLFLFIFYFFLRQRGRIRVCGCRLLPKLAFFKKFFYVFASFEEAAVCLSLKLLKLNFSRAKQGIIVFQWSGFWSFMILTYIMFGFSWLYLTRWKMGQEKNMLRVKSKVSTKNLYIGPFVHFSTLKSATFSGNESFPRLTSLVEPFNFLHFYDKLILTVEFCQTFTVAK